MDYIYAHNQWRGRGWGRSVLLRPAPTPTQGPSAPKPCPGMPHALRSLPIFSCANAAIETMTYFQPGLRTQHNPPPPPPPRLWEYRVTGTSWEQTLLCVFKSTAMLTGGPPWIKYVCGRLEGPDGVRSVTHLIRTPKVSQETASTRGSVESCSAGPAWDSRSQGRDVPSCLPSNYSSIWRFVKVTASFPFTPMCF